MRPLRYSINVTLDGCCDHRAIPADEELHRYAAETEQIVEGFASGGVDYVVKPLKIPEVLARLATHLRNAHVSRLAREAVDVAGLGVETRTAAAAIASSLLQDG